MKALLLRVVRAIRFWWSRAPVAKRRLVEAKQVQEDYRINAANAQHAEDLRAIIAQSEADDYANMVAACDRALSGVGDQRVVASEHVAAPVPYVPVYDEDGEEISDVHELQKGRMQS